MNNAYIGAKIRSSFVNGILKILVVPTQDYEDITISGTDGEHSHTCERPQQKPKKKHHKPKFPYGFMPVYPIPMVPANGNGNNSGHSSDTCNCMDDFVRIDDEDILNIFGSDLTDENDNADIDNTDNNGNNDNADIDNTDNNGNSNIPDDNDNTGNNDNSGDNDNQGNDNSSSDDDPETMSEDDILDILNS